MECNITWQFRNVQEYPFLPGSDSGQRSATEPEGGREAVRRRRGSTGHGGAVQRCAVQDWPSSLWKNGIHNRRQHGLALLKEEIQKYSFCYENTVALWLQVEKITTLSKAHLLLKKASTFKAPVNEQIMRDIFSLTACKINWGMQSSFSNHLFFSSHLKLCCTQSWGWGPCPSRRVTLQHVSLIQKFPLVSMCLGAFNILDWIHL